MRVPLIAGYLNSLEVDITNTGIEDVIMWSKLQKTGETEDLN